MRPADPADPEGLHIARIRPWLTCVKDADGCEHAVLSDGWRRIRLDVAEGRLADQQAVHLHFGLQGLTSAKNSIQPLRRFLLLCQHRRFGPSLFPRDPQTRRWIDMLRVHDAIADGASHRDVAAVLFGESRVASDWSGRSDSLRRQPTPPGS